MPRRPLTDEQREQSRKHRLECDRERQRKRRLNPVLRAIEQGRNTVAKRVSRAKGFYYDNIDILKANIGCSKMISMLVNVIYNNVHIRLQLFLKHLNFYYIIL